MSGAHHQIPGGFARHPSYIISGMTDRPPCVQHHVFDTAIGPCGVAWSERGLAAVQLPERDAAATERRLAARVRGAGAASPPPWVAALVDDIRRALAGDRVDFAAVPVDMSGVEPFRLRLYDTLRMLAWGETTTYGDLAKQLGATGWQGARDVGEAMGRNPVPLVIPCHRVLAAGGRLGGFSAPGGAATKAKLLALEGVRTASGPPSRPPRLPGL
jgi:methylated-DNA-[protein]-cysteine S-methyltransferase